MILGYPAEIITLSDLDVKSQGKGNEYEEAAIKRGKGKKDGSIVSTRQARIYR